MAESVSSSCKISHSKSFRIENLESVLLIKFHEKVIAFEFLLV